MGKISQYNEVPVPKLSDLLIGTSVGLNEEGRVENQTYNFSLQQLLDLFIPNLPSNNLQGVLDIGNTATQDINLFGKITTSELEVTDTATFNKAYFPEEMYLSGLLYDNTYESGVEGDVLSRSADGVKWITLPPIFTPSLQQVLNVGNTSTTDIILNAQLTADDIDVDNIIVNSSIELSGSLKDSAGSSGLLGQVLTSNGTGEVVWGSGAVYTGVAPIAVNSATKEISITKATVSINGYLSSIDFNTFNDKQDALSGSGIVNSTEGTISYIDDNSANWNDAYENTITSAEVTGTTTKTLTLTQRDLGTITASWSDYDTAPVTSVFGRTGAVVAQSGDYTTTQVTEGTNLYYLDSRARAAISLTTTGTSGAATYNSTTGVLNIPNYGVSLTGYVPYTGATNNVDLGAYSLSADYIHLSTTTAHSASVGDIVWNAADGTFDMGLLNGVTLQVGQEMHIYGKASGAIPNGSPVMFAGSQGSHLLLSVADPTSINAHPEYFVGVATQDFTNNQFGYVTVFGQVRDLNTIAYPEGTVLYFNSVSGGFTATIPSAPNAKIIVAAVVRSHATQGSLMVRPHAMPKVENLQDVGLSGVAENDVLVYDTNKWVNKTIAEILGYTPASLSSFSASSPLSYNNTTGAFSIQQASGSQSGYLSSADWTTFNNKQSTITLTTTGSSGSSTLIGGTLNVPTYTLSGLGGVPSSRTITINGTTQSLGTDRTWNVGTVTQVTGIAPIYSTEGTTPVITISPASSISDGYLSSSDWNAFNNKQSAGNYITSLTGEATASGPGAASVTLTNSAVIGKVLTGLNITGGSVSATDSILSAFGKVQNQINGLIGGSIYKGTWNANTNTPALASGVGTTGWYYIVSVAGTTDLDGITDWNVGDWAIFDGTAWQQVDNTDAVVSVNGFTGAVSLTTTNIPEGTSLYYLDSRARAALSFAAGSGAYNSTTGLITIPTNTSQLTNGANFITLGSLSASTPLSYNNSTGAFSISQAGPGSSGYLSNTDYNTFNAKQNAITLTTTGTSGAATLVGSTLNIPQYADQYVGTVTSVGLSAPTGFSVGSSPVTTSGTIALSFASGYSLPTDAKQTQWDTAYTNRITSASAPLSISSNNISISQATTSTNGYLSSTDWNTFNNKQSALTNPVTGTGTSGYHLKFTGSTTVGNSLIYDNGTNVGIGTTSPSAKLYINNTASTSNPALQIASSGSLANQIVARFQINGVTNGFTMGQDASSNVYYSFDGMVGIGTANPSYKLQVVGGSSFGGAVRLSSATTDIPNYTESGWVSYSAPTFRQYIGDGSGYDYRFSIRNSGVDYDRITIKDSGYVGILTTSPAAPLDVNGTIKGSHGYFTDLGTGTVYSTGGQLTSTNPSDERLKKDIKSYNYGLNEVLQLQPKTYYYKDDEESKLRKYGFIAQDVQEIMPELIDEFDVEDETYLGLNTDGIYVALVNAIKELKAEIDILKANQNINTL